MTKRFLQTGIVLAGLVFLVGCASFGETDRSYLNHKAMDLRIANDLGEPAPGTGLRNLKKAGGSEACSVCAK